MNYEQAMRDLGFATGSAQDEEKLRKNLLDNVLRHYSLGEWEGLSLSEKVDYLAPLFISQNEDITLGEERVRAILPNIKLIRT